MTGSDARSAHAPDFGAAVERRRPADADDRTIVVAVDAEDADRLGVGSPDGRLHLAPLDAPYAQPPLRASAAVLTAEAYAAVPDSLRRLLIHNIAAYLLPAAPLAVETARLHTPIAEHATPCGFEEVDRIEGWQIFQRTSRTTIQDLVAQARAGLDRLTPGRLAQLLDADECLVLDSRTPTDRARFGTIPGAIHTPRTTLEWLCDPASGYSHERVVGFDQLLVVVCNEGYSSSLSAASLQRLGFHRATDLIGGVLGWKTAGFPVEMPDHSTLS